MNGKTSAALRKAKDKLEDARRTISTRLFLRRTKQLPSSDLRGAMALGEDHAEEFAKRFGNNKKLLREYLDIVRLSVPSFASRQR